MNLDSVAQFYSLVASLNHICPTQVGDRLMITRGPNKDKFLRAEMLVAVTALTASAAHEV